MTLVAGIDSSTQSCKIVVRDAATGTLIRAGRAAHPDGTEVEPRFWWDALLSAIAEAGGLDDVAALSVGGQQHGMVALDEDGRVIRPALLWNDTRSADAARSLVTELGAEQWAHRTGTVPVASFTASKLRWLQDAEPDNTARIAAIALPHDWLTWRLRGYGPLGESPLGPELEALTTDRSDASGTSYWGDSGYDEALFERALGRPAREAAGAGAHKGGRDETVLLPRVLGPAESSGSTATIDSASFSRPPSRSPEAVVPAGILVGAGAGDNASAALGLGARTGDVVVSIGTSGTVFAVTDAPTHDRTGTVAGFADASGHFLPLVATLNAARVLTSTAELLGVGLDELGALSLTAEPGAGGLTLVPYFEGERTPNLPDATATLHGMTIASTTRANLARAAIEGMLCGLADGLEALRAQGIEATRIILIGGAAQNPAVQTVATQVFDLPVVVPTPGEYGADGAATQAAWALTGHRPRWTVTTHAEPGPDHRPLIREQYARYTADPGKKALGDGASSGASRTTEIETAT